MHEAYKVFFPISV